MEEYDKDFGSVPLGTHGVSLKQILAHVSMVKPMACRPEFGVA